MKSPRCLLSEGESVEAVWADVQGQTDQGNVETRGNVPPRTKTTHTLLASERV